MTCRAQLFGARSAASLGIRREVATRVAYGHALAQRADVADDEAHRVSERAPRSPLLPEPNPFSNEL
jgi:hypothetical protein